MKRLVFCVPAFIFVCGLAGAADFSLITDSWMRIELAEIALTNLASAENVDPNDVSIGMDAELEQFLVDFVLRDAVFWDLRLATGFADLQWYPTASHVYANLDIGATTRIGLFENYPLVFEQSAQLAFENESPYAPGSARELALEYEGAVEYFVDLEQRERNLYHYWMFFFDGRADLAGTSPERNLDIGVTLEYSLGNLDRGEGLGEGSRLPWFRVSAGVRYDRLRFYDYNPRVVVPVRVRFGEALIRGFERSGVGVNAFSLQFGADFRLDSENRLLDGVSVALNPPR